jgi:serine/threonine protein kinase/Tol biopolymer transport system component
MNYAIGTTLGHYSIVEPIGAGGMGEVYKARDSRLERAVALKVLPPHLVTDAERVRRFVGEAKAASALNHPNIVTIYDIGESQPDPSADSSALKVYYIAMEFVDGLTLHAKIHRDRSELKKLLEYFAQTAEGLAKAHGSGIVHRDLKPENIMVTGDGYAKILDFGLAKLVEPEGGPASGGSAADLEEAETAVMQRTQAGVVMGTVGYMSPEQAQGKSVDHRSDIFSFGCMLYEAATGLKPFHGDSLIDSLHRIVYSQPAPIRDSNPNAPVELQRIIRKCLAKDTAERYQSIKDVAIDLRELIKEYESQPTLSGVYVPAMQLDGKTGSGTHSQPSMGSMPAMASASNPQMISGPVSGIGQPAARKIPWVPIIGGLVLLAAVGFLAVYLVVGQKQSKKTGPAFQNTQLSKLTSTGRSLRAVISPDGKYAVHLVREAGKTALWVRQIATASNVQVVPPAEGDYVGMTFSRDGNYVYYTWGERGSAIRSLYQIPVLSGTPKKMIEDVDSAISFAPDGRRVVFVRHSPAESGLFIANADGSGEQKLVAFTQPDVFLVPAWSPDGKVIAVSSRKVSGGFGIQLSVVQVADGAITTLGTQKWLGIDGVAWLPDGSAIVLSARDQTPSSRSQIWEISYPDGATRRITNDLNEYSGVSLSSDASMLVTVQTDLVANVFVGSAAADEKNSRQVTQGSGRYNYVSWAPDNRIVYISDAGGGADVWTMEADGSNQRQLTSDAGLNIFPSLGPDGKYIVLDSNRGLGLTAFSVWRIGLDGSNPKRLTDGEFDFFPTVTPDGRWVVFNRLSEQKPAIWKVPIDGGDAAVLLDKPAIRPVISPDGKLVACQYRSGVPTEGAVLGILSIDSGDAIQLLKISLNQYRWTPDSKSILYVDHKEGVGNVWSQPVGGGPPKQLTQFKTGQMFSFDWSRDGKQSLASRGSTSADVVLIKDQAREPKE